MIVQNKGGIGNPNHDELGRFTEANNVLDKTDTLFGVDTKQKDIRMSLPSKTMSGDMRSLIKYEDESVEDRKKLLERWEKEDKDFYGEDFINKCNDDRAKTIEIDTPERETARHNWVKEEINKQSMTYKQKGRRAVFVLGLPASGKSSFTESLVNDQGAFMVDSDIFKEGYITEFKLDSTMSNKSQQEAGKLADAMMVNLAMKGYNMCLGKVGGNIKPIQNSIKLLKKYGYRVDIVYNDLPASECVNRLHNRFEKQKKRGEQPRYVPSEVVYKNESKILDTFNKLMNDDNVDGGIAYSNDVPFGERPKLLAKYKNMEDVFA